MKDQSTLGFSRATLHSFFVALVVFGSFIVAAPPVSADDPGGNCSQGSYFQCPTGCTAVQGSLFNCCDTQPAGACCERICRQVTCSGTGCGQVGANFAAGTLYGDRTCESNTGHCLQ